MNHPDKSTLIGYCSRLPLCFDPDTVIKELNSIPENEWVGTGGRVGVHSQVNALFLRGYAPAEGDKPIIDRPILNSLPFIQLLVSKIIPAEPKRCLLAQLKPASRVAPHTDNGDYFSKYIRIHFSIITQPKVFMYCGDQVYHMQPGEIWALNNSGATHAVANFDDDKFRTHLICDYEPSPELLELLRLSNKALGQPASSVPF